MVIVITIAAAIVIGVVAELILFRKFQEKKSNREFATSEYFLGGLVIQTVIIVLSCVIGLYINNLAEANKDFKDAVTKAENVAELCNMEVKANNSYAWKYKKGEKDLEYVKTGTHLNVEYYGVMLTDPSIQKYMDSSAFYHIFVNYERMKSYIAKMEAAETDDEYYSALAYAMFNEAVMADAIEIGIDSMLKNITHDEVKETFQTIQDEYMENAAIKSYYDPIYLK